jgi:hypothetical protein
MHEQAGKKGAEMTNSGKSTMTYADLERLLEVYGSDRTRWPVEARASAGQLAARDAAARQLLREAEALDRVLERAPLPSLAMEAALAERILAAARRSPRMVPLAHTAAATAAEQGVGNIVRWPMSRMAWRPLASPALGGAASLLAASLALGVFIGLSGLPQRVLPALEQMTGMALGNNNYTLAQIDPLDEDLL